MTHELFGHEGFPIQENVSVKVADNSEIYTDDMSA